MKTSEFRRWLAEHGAVFEEGSKHTKVYVGKKQTTLPRHKEIPDLLVKAIKKQLGLK